MIGLIIGISAVFFLLYLGKNKRKKIEELPDGGATKSDSKAKANSLIQKPFIKWVLWIVVIWLLIGWFFNFPSYNPKAAFWEGISKIQAGQEQARQNQAEEGITFAPGETKKVIKLEPGKWTEWIITPTETTYRVDGPKDLLLRFIDGTIVENKSPCYVGIKRGIFKLTANSFGEAIIVVEKKY